MVSARAWLSRVGDVSLRHRFTQADVVFLLRGRKHRHALFQVQFAVQAFHRQVLAH
jgi:hypothetical protein